MTNAQLNDYLHTKIKTKPVYTSIMEYIYFSSEDAISTSNTTNDFTYRLPRPIRTISGVWEVALTSIHGPLPTAFNVCCDIVEESNIKDTRRQILRQVVLGDSLHPWQFMKMYGCWEVSVIHIQLTDLQLKPLKLPQGPVFCTLCLRKRHKGVE